jgi:nucleoid-associated protein YgaU
VNTLGTNFDLLLTRGALGALVVAALWAVMVVVAAAAEARTHGRIRLTALVGCPRPLQVWLVGVFVALFAGMAPAHAGDAGSGAGSSGSGTTIGTAIRTAVDGLPLPDRAVGSSTARRPTGRIVVAAGDSLWRIAERVLPAGATDSTIAAAVARVYAANTAAIGPDPDLLIPGQRLAIDISPGFPDTTTPQEEP